MLKALLSYSLLRSPHYGQREAISPSLTFTSNLTSCQMTPLEQQICSMLFFVCSLPVFLRAALWYSQQVANLAVQQQRLNVLKHTSCSKWRFVGKQIKIKHSVFHSGYSKMELLPQLGKNRNYTLIPGLSKDILIISVLQDSVSNRCVLFNHEDHSHKRENIVIVAVAVLE